MMAFNQRRMTRVLLVGSLTAAVVQLVLLSIMTSKKGNVGRQAKILNIHHSHNMLMAMGAISKESSWSTSHGTASSIDEMTLIVTLSLGENAAKSPLVERCIRSVRGPGNFKGYFAVLTDAPKERYADIIAADDKFIVLQVKEDDKRKDIHFQLSMKLFKTLIPKYVQHEPLLANIEFITYIDFDVIVGEDLNKFHSMFSLKRLEDQKHFLDTHPEELEGISTIYFFDELGGGRKGMPYHSGVFFLDRRSEHCLDLWGREIVANCCGKLYSLSDQGAIARVGNQIAVGNETKCRLFTMPRKDNLLFPDKWSMERNQTATFVHITNSFRARDIPQAIQSAFIANILNLSTEEQSIENTFVVPPVHIRKGDIQ